MTLSTLVLIGAITLVFVVALLVAYKVRVQREDVGDYALSKTAWLIGVIGLVPIFWLLHANGLLNEGEESTLGRTIRYGVFILMTGVGALYLWAIRPRKR